MHAHSAVEDLRLWGSWRRQRLGRVGPRLKISRAGARAACAEGDLGGVQLGLLLTEVPVLGVITGVEGPFDVLLIGRPDHLTLNRHLRRFDRSLVLLGILIDFDGGLLGGQQGAVASLVADLGVLLLEFCADVHLLLLDDGGVAHANRREADGGPSSSIGVVVVTSGIVLSGGSIVGIGGEPGVVDGKLQGGDHLIHGADGGSNLRSLFHRLGEQPSGFFLALNPAVPLDL